MSQAKNVAGPQYIKQCTVAGLCPDEVDFF
jgi:hypothetical protein